ncbi:acyl carrier protein [Robiginitalea sp. SC105]|uniref:acyl carrier protein n=1 Tax=Robiginitalea sp. SC105 TaxID=2762332 RepID=UPI00163B5244|nr:acyl carrier protein [Robiginitalea sp. SC105]MBC2840522.1 acyl carrier protein [Robiginitalea sp. SC105]
MKDHAHYATLREIILPYLPEDIDPSGIGPESLLIEELNINSAHLVDIVLDVEDRFDIRLEDTDMQQMHSVSDALRIIDTKLGNT